MQYLYLLLNLGAILVPLIFSFHPKLKFYKMWPALGLSIIFNMVLFIPWDHIFTVNGFWGFDSNYLIGYSLLELPLEEWLFFICIPLVRLRQTLSIALIIGLLGLAAYHLYFVRQQFINPLHWKNYVIGIGSLVGVVCILLFMETISDLLMMLVGLAITTYSGHQLMMIVIKKH